MPFTRSFSTGRSSTARRPLRNASSCRPERRRLDQANTAPDHNLVEPGRVSPALRVQQVKANCALVLIVWPASDKEALQLLDCKRRSGKPRDAPCLFVSMLSVQSVVNLFWRRIHGCFSSQSFWKRGSERSGSHTGSSLSIGSARPFGTLSK
jgi:hypothetical protein